VAFKNWWKHNESTETGKPFPVEHNEGIKIEKRTFVEGEKHLLVLFCLITLCYTPPPSLHHHHNERNSTKKKALKEESTEERWKSQYHMHPSSRIACSS
jgi:hypothetical protein